METKKPRSQGVFACYYKSILYQYQYNSINNTYIPLMATKIILNTLTSLSSFFYFSLKLNKCSLRSKKTKFKSLYNSSSSPSPKTTTKFPHTTFNHRRHRQRPHGKLHEPRKICHQSNPTCQFHYG